MGKDDEMIRESSDVAAEAAAPRRRLRAEVRVHYEAILHRLPWPGGGLSGSPRTLGVSSCQGGEGVSTVAAPLAITAASLGDHRVVLVDANWRGLACRGSLGFGGVRGWRKHFKTDMDFPRFCRLPR